MVRTKYQALGNRIQEQRLKQRKKQAQIAKEIGVVPSVYSRWESGQILPTRNNLDKIAKVLDIPLAELKQLSWEEADMPAAEPFNILPIIRTLNETKMTLVTLQDLELLVNLQQKLENPSDPLSLEVIEAILERRQSNPPSPE